MYKYLKGEHADDMLERGRVRITTLYECRAWEHAELGDPDEGKGTMRQTIENQTFTAERPIYGPLATSMAFGAGTVSVGRISGSWEVDFPDCYLYCMTLAPDAEVMRRFGCDACVRINNPWQFIRTLSEHLRFRRLVQREVQINECRYESRDREWVEGQPPSLLIKHLRFAHQREARAYWTPIRRPIAPLFIDSLAAATYCDRYALH
jgi:hypothetical protein